MKPGAHLSILLGCLLLAPCLADAISSRVNRASPVLAAKGGQLYADVAESIKATNLFVTDYFCGSGHCVRCHDGMRDEEGETVSLVEEWKVSLMAFSFVDPLWKAKVRSETLRLPDKAAAIEKKCVTCHGPMAATEAVFNGDDVSIFDDGFDNPENVYHPLAKEGVSCTLCHQILDDNLGTDDSFSGGFLIDSETGRYRLLYGQIENPFTSSMQRSVSYRPALGMHMHGSSVCATCHELMTPYVDADTEQWVPDATFAEQTPYSEWLASDYSKGDDFQSCHDCHLTHAPGVPAAKAPNWLEAREDFSRHTFFTENLTMLSLLETFSRELQIDATGLTESQESGGAYLAGAGKVKLEKAELKDGELEVTLQVHNHTGHKLPTSIPIRRIYLHVTVNDQAHPGGGPVFESGACNEDGTITGVDSDLAAESFEPHHEIITSPEQVQVYEGIMGNTKGEVTYTLLFAAQFLKDNRLLPDGFDKESAPGIVQVYGAAKNDDDFTAGMDTVVYRVAGLEGQAYDVRVELLDQTISYPFLRDLFRNDDDSHVADFQAMYLDKKVDKEPELIHSLTFTVYRGGED